VLNKITEEEFKQKIFERDRRNARKEENHRILETLQTLAIERFRELAQNCRGVRDSIVQLCGGSMTGQVLVRKQERMYKKLVTNFKDEMEKIRKFINDAFQEELPPLGTPYPYIIPKNWNRITYRKFLPQKKPVGRQST